MANIVERGELFSKLLALELKASIITSGHTMRFVSEQIGTHPTTISKYVRGTRILPSDTFSRACEVIGVSPDELVERAYDRLLDELGPYKESHLSVVSDSLDGIAAQDRGVSVATEELYDQQEP